MGIQQSQQQQPYTLFQPYNDPHFGQCNIYKNNFQANNFVLEINFNHSHEHAKMVQESLKKFKQDYFVSKEKFPFLKIVDWKLKDDNNKVDGMCGSGKNVMATCKVPQLTVYIEFLRHNLRDFAKWRMTENKPFSLQEIIMALSKTINAFELTKNNKLFGPSFKLEDISVTIEGEMKFNPLLWKRFFKQLKEESNSGLVKGGETKLMERIKERRALKEGKFCQQARLATFCQRKQYKCPSYTSQESEFLSQLKKLANDLVYVLSSSSTVNKSLIFNNCQNPQDSHFQQKRQLQTFLKQICHAKTIKQVKHLIGEPSIDAFQVDFSKLRHQQSQAKFERILSQLQQKSQRTDYSRQQSPLKLSMSKRLNNVAADYKAQGYYRYR